MLLQKNKCIINAKIICFVFSLLVSTSHQLKGICNDGVDDTKKNVSAQKPNSKSTYSSTKIGIIDGHFNPRGNTRRFLTQSTVGAFVGEDPVLLAKQAGSEGDGCNHANDVSSIIHEKTPKAKLRVIDIYNDLNVKDAGDYNDCLIAAVKAAIRSEVDFINISIRIQPYEDDWKGPISDELKNAFLDAAKHGIGIIKSAGNDSEITGSTLYTISLAELLDKMQGSMIMVVSTADTDGHERLAHDSNKAGIARKFTVAANGTNYPVCDGRTKSGTSIAAAIVTGTAGQLKELYPDLSAADILKAILHSTRRTYLNHNTPLPEDEFGCGVIDFSQAVKELEKIRNR